MKSIFILLDSIITIYLWIIIVNAILSWLVAFNVLNTQNRFVFFTCYESSNIYR